MQKEALQMYFLSKAGAVETFPFDEVTAVYKVGQKMFALISSESENLRINLKCNPDDGIFLRENHSAILPGYHMNKKHWITVVMDGSLTEDFIKQLIDDSYELVLKKMTKSERAKIIKN
jgi:predicted DNA-binding protein (MmcQ/YjbR family)